MNKTLRINLAVALLALAAAHTYASTNWVASVNMSLNANVQGPTATVGSSQVSQIFTRHISTKDLISKLVPTASTAAKLIVKADVNTDTGPTFFVRDNGTDTDVSAKLQVQTSDIDVSAITQNTTTGKKVSTHKFILTVSFNDQSGASFTASGLSTLRQSTLIDKNLGNLGQVPTGLAAQIAGTGSDTEDGLPDSPNFIISGTIAVAAGKIEVN